MADQQPQGKPTEYTGVGVYVDGRGEEASYLTSKEGDFTAYHPTVDPAPARGRQRRRD